MAKATKKTTMGVVVRGTVRGADGQLVMVNRIGEFDAKVAKEAEKRGNLRIHEAAKAPAGAADDQTEAGSPTSADADGTPPSL